MSYCVKCGAVTSDAARFCTSCGAAARASERVEATPAIRSDASLLFDLARGALAVVVILTGIVWANSTH